MKVKYFQRKPIPNFHFSVENIFNDVREHMPPGAEMEVHVVGHFSQGLMNRLRILREVKKAQSPDVNHFTGDIDFASLAARREKVVQTILDLFFLENTSGLKRRLLKLFWVTLPIRRARIVTTISEATKADILRHVDIDPAKIKVIPIALGGVFKFEPRGYNFERPTILQIGSAPNKNVPRIIEAVKDIPCKLIVVGQHTPEYEELLKKHGIDYEYRSGLNKFQMRDLYKTVDILLFPSTIEGFGMPIVEAQAMGALVVTSNISSMPDVAGDGALLVNPYKTEEIEAAVRRLMADGPLREKLLAAGFENIKRFDAAAISQQYFELYKQIAFNGL